jgi:hypothetical protein
LESFLVTLGTIIGLLAIGPLYIAGNTGSWRRGWEAAKSMLWVLGALSSIGAVVGLLVFVVG